MKKELISRPEESNIKDEKYWFDKMSDINIYLLDEYKKKIKKISKRKTKSGHDFKIFNYACEEILTNENIILKALDLNFIYYHQISKTLQNDKNFNIRYITENNSLYLGGLSDTALLDDEIFSMCVKKSERIYSQIYYNSKVYKKYSEVEQVLKYLEVNPKIYQHLSLPLKNDFTVCKKAIQLNVSNIRYMLKKNSSRIFNNEEICNLLIEKDADCFLKINNKFRDNQKVMIAFIQIMPSLIEYASIRLRNDKSFVKHAASAYNLLDFISEDLKRDSDIMLSHLISWPKSSIEISKFQDVKPLLIQAIKKHSYVYENLNFEQKIEPDYIYSVLLHDDFFSKEYQYSYDYKKTNIIKILPEDLQTEILNEYLGIRDATDLNRLSTDERLQEILLYARQKYIDLYLSKNLPDKRKTNQIKI